MPETPRPMSEQHRLELLADAIAGAVVPRLRPECPLAHDTAECGASNSPFMHPSTTRDAARELLDHLRRIGWTP